MKKIAILFFLSLFATINSFANEAKIIDLTKQKWEYKWGDSPFENNIPLWTVQEDSSSKWESIHYPANPPQRDGKTNVWYRVKLPDILTQDPHIYIFSIDLITQVYLKGKQIYHFGEFDEVGKGKYQGWPWHMFSLPKDAQGEYLYFRVYSNYIDLGLFGEILISSEGDILKKMLGNDIPKLIVGSLALFVSLLFFISILTKKVRYELIILGLLFLTQGLNVLCNVKIIQIYIHYPLINQYILAISLFTFPLGMAMYMDLKIRYKTPFNIIKRIWQIHLIYVLGAFFGSIFGLFDIASTYKYFDILYYFITLPILTIFMIYFFFKGNNEIKLVTISFLIISIYWIISFLIAYSILPWSEYPADIAVFLSLLLLTYSVIRKLNYTNELENEKKYFKILSTTDYLTKLYNREEIDKILKRHIDIFKRYNDVFSIIILDIDDFKNVNDTYGHLTGDKVLIELSNILISNTRETDFAGRWGGEEFIIICPKTNKEEILVISENIRKKIEEHDFEEVGYKTASFGVTSFESKDSLTTLISKADKAMYISKTKGKNCVNFM